MTLSRLSIPSKPNYASSSLVQCPATLLAPSLVTHPSSRFRCSAASHASASGKGLGRHQQHQQVRGDRSSSTAGSQQQQLWEWAVPLNSGLFINPSHAVAPPVPRRLSLSHSRCFSHTECRSSTGEFYGIRSAGLGQLCFRLGPLRLPLCGFGWFEALAAFRSPALVGLVVFLSVRAFLG